MFRLRLSICSEGGGYVKHISQLQIAWCLVRFVDNYPPSIDAGYRHFQ